MLTSYFHQYKSETNIGSLKNLQPNKTKPLNIWITPAEETKLLILRMCWERQLNHFQILCPGPLIEEILLLQAALCMWSLKPIERHADISGAPDGHKGPPTWSTACQKEHPQ